MLPEWGTITDYILNVKEHLSASVGLNKAKGFDGISGYDAKLTNGREVANVWSYPPDAATTTPLAQ